MNLTDTFIQPQDTRLRVAGESITANSINTGRISLGTLNANVELRLPLTVKQAAKRYKKAVKAHEEAQRIAAAAEAALHMTQDKTREARQAMNEARAELDKAAKR